MSAHSVEPRGAPHAGDDTREAAPSASDDGDTFVAATPVSPPAAPPAHPAPPPAGVTGRRSTPWYAWPIGVALGALLLALVGCCALAGLAFGLIGHLRGAPAASQTTVTTVPVSGMPQLIVRDPAGSVTVMPGADGQVRVQATKQVFGVFENDSARTLDAIQVLVSQSGDTVTVTVQLPGQRFGGFGGGRLVDLAILVPARSNLTANLAAGNLTLGALSGQMTVAAKAGNVDASGITLSGASRITDTAGNVSLDGALADGASLDVHVNAGNVSLRLPVDTPAHLSARASVGSVTVTGWPINVTHPSAQSASASGDLGANPTGAITVTVDSGNATIAARQS